MYCEIRRALYGLKEDGKLANVDLEKVLATKGYHPCRFTPGLYRHKTRNTKFALCTDDFACSITSKADAEHLIATLKTKYEITVDWKGEGLLVTRERIC